MGNRLTNNKSINKLIGKNSTKLDESAYMYLCNETKQSRFVIEEIIEKFFEENKKDYLDKKDFIKLYCQLRAEPEKKLSKIADYVFNAFDKNKDGILTYYFSLRVKI